MVFLYTLLSLILFMVVTPSFADLTEIEVTKQYPPINSIAKHFGVGGKGGNFRSDLWLKGAAQIIPQLNELIDFVSPGFVMESMTVEEGHEFFKMKEYHDKVEKLGSYLTHFKSDKSVFYQHYHHVYAYIFEELGKTNQHLRTLEIGMGTNNTNLVSTMGANGRPGASLRAFAKYLPEAEIFGADIDRDILFQSDRIRTTFVDGYDFMTYQTLYETFGSQPFDLIIDDAAHATASDFNTLLFALAHINIPGYIVIEDISPVQFESYRVIDYLLKTRMSEEVVIKSSMVFTAHKRNGLGKKNPLTKNMIFVVSLHKKV